jgi:hypothetical protein
MSLILPYTTYVGSEYRRNLRAPKNDRSKPDMPKFKKSYKPEDSLHNKTVPRQYKSFFC